MLTVFNSYPSFLVFLGLFVSMVITMCAMPAFIRFMRREKVGQQVREEGLVTHYKKQGTPTMGGIVMVLAVVVSALFVGDVDNKTISLIVVALLSAIVGLVDDYKKIHYKNTEGMSAKTKLISQGLVACAFILYAVNELNIAPTLVFYHIGIVDLGVFSTVIDLGDGNYFVIPWLYLIFCLILLVGMCNAVNLTDGLDGLAGGSVMLVMIVMAFIAYKMNNLQVSVFAAATAGSCAAFLWFNSNPAEIFMGDTGSLSLGMTFGALSILTKTEVLVILMGGLFVAEALSVMIQVFYFKKTRKRIFLMAPLHHHFEKKGWGENQVVVRFWMISGFLAAVGFAIFFSVTLI